MTAAWSGVARARTIATEGDRRALLPLVAGLGELVGVVERDSREVKRAAVGDQVYAGAWTTL